MAAFLIVNAADLHPHPPLRLRLATMCASGWHAQEEYEENYDDDDFDQEGVYDDDYGSCQLEPVQQRIRRCSPSADRSPIRPSAALGRRFFFCSAGGDDFEEDGGFAAELEAQTRALLAEVRGGEAGQAAEGAQQGGQGAPAEEADYRDDAFEEEEEIELLQPWVPPDSGTAVKTKTGLHPTAIGGHAPCGGRRARRGSAREASRRAPLAAWRRDAAIRAAVMLLLRPALPCAQHCRLAALSSPPAARHTLDARCPTPPSRTHLTHALAPQL